ncbi:MAG: phosphomannomutase/phosphoglucomutase [Candidatus Woesearchaeota archaeon]
MANIDSSVFKAYDIRGVYPEQINEELAYLIGRAFVASLECREVVVGRDARESSPKLHKALLRGIMDQGADVIDIGLTTTPMFYFTIAEYGHDAGIMITASHNPARYNGMKLCREKAIPIGGETGLQDIRDLVEKNDFTEPERKGEVKDKEPLNDYVRKIMSFSFDVKPIKIVVDAGNGMSPIVFPKLEEELPIESVKMFFDIDCTFPNHEANPSKDENTADLRKKVKGEKAAMGVAFDGDADRVAFVDENGAAIPNDIITALIAEEMLAKNKGEKVLYEVRSSWSVRDTVKANGGTPVLWKAGHALIKEKMRNDDIMFGGEKSGHYFFRDFWYADSAMIALVHVLNILSRKGKSLSELTNPLRRYEDSGELNFEVKDKDEVISRVEDELKEEAVKVMHVDGTTMEFENWWFNLRKSNTEPVIRLNIEADTKEGLESAKQRLKSIIEMTE